MNCALSVITLTSRVCWRGHCPIGRSRFLYSSVMILIQALEYLDRPLTGVEVSIARVRGAVRDS